MSPSHAGNHFGRKICVVTSVVLKETLTVVHLGDAVLVVHVAVIHFVVNKLSGDGSTAPAHLSFGLKVIGDQFTVLRVDLNLNVN